MTFRNMLLSAPIGLALVGLLSAQFVLPPPPLVGGGLRYVRITPNSALSISFGAVGFGYGSICPVPGPFATTNIRQTTIIVNPPAGNPFAGWPTYPRGVLVDPLAVEVLPREFVGAAGDREEDRIQVRVDRAPPVRVVREEPAPPRVAPLPMPPREEPAQAEYLRLVTEGKTVFGRGEYGRAAERFSQAIERVPGDGPAWFLRSQARIAVGKFHDAARDLREGLRRFPDGLLVGFQLGDLYGDRAADVPVHREMLEQTARRFAGDVDLALLAAVQSWLAGDRVEAKARMEKVEGADRPLVQPFLLFVPR